LKPKFLIAILSIILVLSVALLLWMNREQFFTSPNRTSAPATQSYLEYKPDTVKGPEQRPLYKISDDLYLSSGSRKSAAQELWYLFGLRKTGGNYLVSYQSKDFADAVYLDLSFFKSAQPGQPVIILGEYGNEFSWGIAVFLVKDFTITEIGLLNVGVSAQVGGGGVSTIVSAVPYTQITADKKGYRFTFTKDLVYLDKRFRPVKKEDIYFTYENGTFRVVMK
jgi:hypothetical protein